MVDKENAYKKMNIEGCCVVFNNERIVPYIENHSKKDVIVNPRVEQSLGFSHNCEGQILT